jgi:predicted Rossmann-fold nucleotide-binding protein
MGTAYWRPLLDQLRVMVAEGTIDEADLRLFLATDDIEAAIAHLRTYAIESFGLRPRRRPHRSRLLGEPRVPVEPVAAVRP